MDNSPWLSQGRSSVAAATPDGACVTHARNDEPGNSNVGDEDLEGIINSLTKESSFDQIVASSRTMSTGEFDLSEISLDTLHGFGGNGSVSGDPRNSLSMPFFDPNAAIESYEDWQSTSNGTALQHGHVLVNDPGPHAWDLPYQYQMYYHRPSQDDLSFMPSTSNPVGVSSITHLSQPITAYTDSSSTNIHQEVRPWAQPAQSVHAPDDLFGENDERERGDVSDPCYAQLLYQCLKKAPNHTLSLRELYEWVAQHSQKAKDPKNHGWQNSVRHNLSMNAAFARVLHHGHSGPKKGSLWRLTEEALQHGVISTTRYRKDPKRRVERRAMPAVKRQASGAKGGRATRDATRLRQQQQRLFHGLQNEASFRRSDRSRDGISHGAYPDRSVEASPPSSGFIPPTPAISPYFIDDSAGISLSMSESQTPPHLPQGVSTPPSHLQFNCNDNQVKQNELSPSFEFMPLDHIHAGLFGDHDPEMNFHSPDTPTPSLMTEASFDESAPHAATMLPSPDGAMKYENADMFQ